MGILRNGYTIDYANNTVKMTKDFSEKAQVEGTTEYRTLKRIKRDFPEISIERRTVTRVKKGSVVKVPYETMTRYISYLRDQEQYFNEMNRLMEFGGGKEKAYHMVNNWFLTNFPQYNDLPKFDGDGFIILTDTNETTNVRPLQPKAV